MASPSRTRARKSAQSKEEKDYSQEEMDLAAAQENNQLQAAQLQYLQGRVGQLRLELNRAHQEIERLTSMLDG